MLRLLAGVVLAFLVACSSSPQPAPSPNGGTELHVVRLEHRSAVDVAAELEAILRGPTQVRRLATGAPSSGPAMAGPSAFAAVDHPWSVGAHEPTGSVLLVGSPEQLGTMRSLVTLLDVPDGPMTANGR